MKSAPKRRPAPSAKLVQRRRCGRYRYSDAEREQILAAAQKGGLTALQVQKRFGVRSVTYYLWRKKAKVRTMQASRLAAPGRPKNDALAGIVRESVQERLRAIAKCNARTLCAAMLNWRVSWTGVLERLCPTSLPNAGARERASVGSG